MNQTSRQRNRRNRKLARKRRTDAIQVRKCGTPDAFPHALLSPALEPSPHRRWRAILTWQILPATSRGEHIQNALNRPTVVGARTTRVRWRRQ